MILNDIGPEVALAGLQRIASYVGRHDPVASWEEAAAQMRAMYGVAMPDACDEEWMAFARRSYTEVDGTPRLDVDPAIGEAVRAAPSNGAPDLWPIYAALGPCRSSRSVASCPTCCPPRPSSGWRATSPTSSA